MAEMLRKGSGTYNQESQTWRYKGKKEDGIVIRPDIQKSIAQLEDILKTDIPRTKLGSRPFWQRYLDTVLEELESQKGKESPLQEKIASLERYITEFKEDGKDTTELQKELAEAWAVPHWDRDEPNMPAIHPSMREAANLALLDGAGEITLRILNSLAPKPIGKALSLKAKAEAKIELHKARGGKGWYDVRTALNLLLEATGDISIKELTEDMFSNFNKSLDKKGWDERTKSNRMKIVKAFLTQVEASNSHLKISYGFIRSTDYERKRPREGKKVQWSFGEVKMALAEATGLARLALLLGLNCGHYWGDITDKKPENRLNDLNELLDNPQIARRWHCDGEHLTTGRSKNISRKGKRQQEGTVGTWKLWPETMAAFQEGVSESQIVKAFNQLREQLKASFPKAKHGFEQSDLRKTIAQMIHDSMNKIDGTGDECSRLYRCEKVKGEHGKSYIQSFSPAQIELLDKALDHIRTKLFG